MADKQIIIDGVDVSGCEFAPKEIGWCNNGNLSSYCKDNPNCYYKQLKRKEQECEKLKNDKFALEVHIDSLTSPVNVDDCEHSVYNGEYIACRYYEGQRCDELDFSNCMFRENVRLKQQVDQLKQTLQEIKELIQSEYCIEIESCEFCDEVGDCLNRKILQKISEVKDV